MKKIFYLFSLLTLGVILSFTPAKKKIIVIDAGHGGKDLGANVNKINEKDITLNIAKKIKELSKSKEDFEIILTRDNDTELSLGERISKINKLNPDYVISLHMNNSKKPSDNGLEVFIQEKESSKMLAEKFGQIFNISKLAEGDLQILKTTDAPTIVMELGYLTNENERIYFSSPEGQNAFAEKFIYFLEQK